MRRGAAWGIAAGAALAGVALLWAGVAAACGVETRCVVGDRHYHIHLPDGAATPKGALVFAHGYRGTARGVVRNPSLQRFTQERGLALIALKSLGDDWALPGAPDGVAQDAGAELAYVDAVVEDAVARFGIDPNRLVASGFSAGGMMTWTLACRRSERFAGFIPVAGVFWRPIPERCDGRAANVVHVHGDGDGVVPLRGRRIGAAHQGEVAAVLTMYARYAGHDDGETKRYGELTCVERKNATGAILDFCLFPGGHELQARHLAHGWGRLAAAGAL